MDTAKAAPETRRAPAETGLLSYTDEQLGNLLAGLAGDVQQPGYPGYNDDRMVFMHSYQSYPQLIIHAACETDVVAALAFARATGLKVTTRSGGHSTAGYSSNDQILLDTGRIDHVLIDRAAHRARVGPGANFRKLNLMLDAAGLHVPGGGCETVCVAGYMQGGGYGFTSRLFGMNCDHVHAVTIVTADGHVRRASADENADIFWAVRGGTGNQFGVLTEIEYDLVPLGDVFGFGLRWPLETEADRAKAAQVLATFQREYTGEENAQIGLQALLMRMPDKENPQGQTPWLMIRGLVEGGEAEAKSGAAPLLELVDDRASQIEIWEPGRYRRMNEILLQTVEPPGLDMPIVSMNTKPLVDSRIVNHVQDAAFWAAIVDHFLAAPDGTTFVAAEPYGGAVNRVAPDATAFVHRRDSLDLFSWSFWTFDATADAARDWLDRFADLAGRGSDGRRYQNYPRRGAPDFRLAYFGGNFDRLLKIKRAVDPADLFGFEQGISPEPRRAGET